MLFAALSLSFASLAEGPEEFDLRFVDPFAVVPASCVAALTLPISPGGLLGALNSDLEI